MDTLQSRALFASQTLNDLTGYTEIERIKSLNERLEADHASAQTELALARTTYKDVNARRATTQREVTTLLARKDAWAPQDLERFTTLYRTDHEIEASVARAAAALTEAEAREARLSSELTQGMLRRYHEEQIWSDRIRRQSTWGTWGLMGVNVLLFLALQFVAEPWRRGRLVKGVVEAEAEVLEEVRRELGAVKEALAFREAAIEGAAPTANVNGVPSDHHLVDEGTPVATASSSRPAWREIIADPASWRGALTDLYSERRVDLRMRDATVIAAQGAAAGATIVGMVAAFWFRRA